LIAESRFSSRLRGCLRLCFDLNQAIHIYLVKELVATPVRFGCLKKGECDAVPLA
jgi:hypothetical protein